MSEDDHDLEGEGAFDDDGASVDSHDGMDEAMSVGLDPKLPIGITKEILVPAPANNWRRPKAGDEVTVHYVGKLESDGSEFDSSRSREKPFGFTLGQGRVIRGWEQGVATMKVGEMAKFTFAPEFAYGESGSPPKIPPQATLIFEIELLSFESKDDLFADGGVIKTKKKDGTGWKEPKDGEEVQISVKVTHKDDNSVDDKGTLEYVLGTGALGPISKAVDKALKGMKKGESVSLECSKDYALYDGKASGVCIDLTLEQIFEIKDVSPLKNKVLMSKKVSQADGFEIPKEAMKVTVKVEAATDGTTNLPGFVEKTLEFALGNGEVCDALEFAVAEMKKSEKVILTCVDPEMCKEEQIGLKDIAAKKVVFHLEMVNFEKPKKDTFSMSEVEKIEYGTARKEVGSALFKAGRFAMALERYKKVIDVFSYTDNYQEDTKGKAQALRKVCELNRAACQLKFKDYAAVVKGTNNILKDDPDNVKALFRRAQAHLGLNNFDDCTRDVKRILDSDPQNREARALHKEALAGQKEQDKKSAGMFGKMCGALGKGPIREPFKDKRLNFDEPKEETK